MSSPEAVGTVSRASFSWRTAAQTAAPYLAPSRGGHVLLRLRAMTLAPGQRRTLARPSQRPRSCSSARGALFAEARGLRRVAQGAQSRVAPTDDLEVLQLRSNFYMIAGAGGNIGVQVGEDGVVVVDAGRRRGPTRSSPQSRGSRRGRSVTSSTRARTPITWAATRRCRRRDRRCSPPALGITGDFLGGVGVDSRRRRRYSSGWGHRLESRRPFLSALRRPKRSIARESTCP